MGINIRIDLVGPGHGGRLPTGHNEPMLNTI